MSDEWPVPKSSMARRTPRPFSPSRVATPPPLTSTSAFSVISKQRCEASAPLRAMAAPTSTAKPAVLSWRPERLIDTVMGGASTGWSERQAAAWATASATTQAPRGTMRPVSSAMGMNSAGGMSPRSG